MSLRSAYIDYHWLLMPSGDNWLADDNNNNSLEAMSSLEDEAPVGCDFDQSSLSDVSRLRLAPNQHAIAELLRVDICANCSFHSIRVSNSCRNPKQILRFKTRSRMRESFFTKYREYLKLHNTHKDSYSEFTNNCGVAFCCFREHWPGCREFYAGNYFVLGLQIWWTQSFDWSRVLTSLIAVRMFSSGVSLPSVHFPECAI